MKRNQIENWLSDQCRVCQNECPTIPHYITLFHENGYPLPFIMAHSIWQGHIPPYTIGDIFQIWHPWEGDEQVRSGGPQVQHRHHRLQEHHGHPLQPQLQGDHGPGQAGGPVWWVCTGYSFWMVVFILRESTEKPETEKLVLKDRNLPLKV